MTQDDDPQGAETRILVPVSNNLKNEVDTNLLPQLRRSGKKFQRSALIRSLLTLACEAAPYLDISNIRDEETLWLGLLKALTKLGENEQATK